MKFQVQELNKPSIYIVAGTYAQVSREAQIETIQQVGFDVKARVEAGKGCNLEGAMDTIACCYYTENHFVKSNK